MIEVTTFKLRDGVGEAAFLAADVRVQTEFIPNRPGFARRTTARGEHGEWLVITLWQSDADADASAAAGLDHPVVVSFNALIEAVATKRYRELD